MSRSEDAIRANVLHEQRSVQKVDGSVKTDTPTDADSVGRHDDEEHDSSAGHQSTQQYQETEFTARRLYQAMVTLHSVHDHHRDASHDADNGQEDERDGDRVVRSQVGR